MGQNMCGMYMVCRTTWYTASFWKLPLFFLCKHVQTQPLPLLCPVCFLVMHCLLFCSVTIAVSIHNLSHKLVARLWEDTIQEEDWNIENSFREQHVFWMPFLGFIWDLVSQLQQPASVLQASPKPDLSPWWLYWVPSACLPKMLLSSLQLTGFCKLKALDI